MQYALIHNKVNEMDVIVALPSIATLGELAFDKGWRVLHQDIPHTDLPSYHHQFGKYFRVLDELQFYLEYLVDEEMSEEDTAYIESCLQENFYEDVHPDSDEEEIDHEFHFMEAPLCDDEEFNRE